MFLAFLCLNLAYNLLPDVIPTYPKKMYTCRNFDQRLQKTLKDAAEQISSSGFPVRLVNSQGSASIICNSSSIRFGSTFVNNSTFTSTLIENRMIHFPNAFFNTMMHELLHAIGLDHSKGVPGMMSYSVRVEPSGAIIEDSQKLWLSIDDVFGLLHLTTIARRVT